MTPSGIGADDLSSSLVSSSYCLIIENMVFLLSELGDFFEAVSCAGVLMAPSVGVTGFSWPLDADVR